MRNNLGRSDLKRQSDRRNQDQQSIDSGGVAKAAGAEKSGNRDVVDKVGCRCEAGTGEQHETPRKNTGSQRFRFLCRNVQLIETPMTNKAKSVELS